MAEPSSWEALAEIELALHGIPKSQTIYCLCSRVFLKNINDNENEGEKTGGNSVSEKKPTAQDKTIKNKNTGIKADDESVSCYHSASHTDNNYSTDEYESHHQVQNLIKGEGDEVNSSVAGVDGSDSGADLSDTEKPNTTEQDNKLNQELFIEINEGDEEIKTKNSESVLLQTFNDPELVRSWDRFWAENSKKIVWASWISQYGDYIHPKYLDGSVTSSSSAAAITRHLLDRSSPSLSWESSDSMTTVTQITVSSLDEDLLSVKSSSQFSEQSSDCDPSIDLYWHEKWRQHCEEQYNIAYSEFVICNQKEPDTQFTLELPEQPTEPKKSVPVTGVGYLLESLRIEQSNEEEIIVKRQKFQNLDSFDSPIERDSSECSPEHKATKPPEISDSGNDNLAKIKSATSLLGFSYGETLRDERLPAITKASVSYRKRNIKGQNRHLKLRINNRSGDDGQALPQTSAIDKVKQYLASQQSVSQSNTCQEVTLMSSSDEEDHEKWNRLTRFRLKNSLTSTDGQSCSELGGETKDDEYLCRKPPRKRKRKQQRRNVPQEVSQNPELLKYWAQRFQLFSKYSDGIRLDTESWVSVTPELVAQHIAQRCSCQLIIDAFCGAGGNAIQFALTCQRVIAIDIDADKIELAKHNAKVYGVSDKIDFIVGDYKQLALNLKADVVYLAPTWGSAETMKQEVIELDKMGDLDGIELINLTSNITKNIAFYLPRNINTEQVIRVAGAGGQIEIEQNFLNKKLVAVTAYYGDLVGQM